MKISVFLKIFIILSCLLALNLYAETAKEAETTRGNFDESDIEETFWIPITPGINNPSRSSNRENEENRLSEKDLNLINKMIKIYKGNDFDFELYPNPSNNLLKIKTKNFKPNTYNVVISNLDGNTQLNQDYNFGDNELLEINIGSLSNGVYIISIYTESQTISKKFVVE